MTVPLDAHAIAVLALTAVAFGLFMHERVPIQTTSVGVLAALTFGFQLFPYARDGVRFSPISLFLGFGHEALVAICGLMIIGKGLAVTGALDAAGLEAGEIDVAALEIDRQAARVLSKQDPLYIEGDSSAEPVECFA